MIIKINSKIIELNDWTIIDNIYLLRTDKVNHYNSIGFLITNNSPRFFGKDFNFMIDTWYSFNTVLTSNAEKNKQIIDNFLFIISENLTFQEKINSDEPKILFIEIVDDKNKRYYQETQLIKNNNSSFATTEQIDDGAINQKGIKE